MTSRIAKLMGVLSVAGALAIGGAGTAQARHGADDGARHHHHHHHGEGRNHR